MRPAAPGLQLARRAARGLGTATPHTARADGYSRSASPRRRHTAESTTTSSGRSSSTHARRKDLIILPDRVVRNWWRRDGHALVLDDPVEVLDELPPHLVVGTGAHGRMRPDPTTLQQLWERGVTVETLPTGQVVRRFAALDPAGTAAALHLTCQSAERELATGSMHPCWHRSRQRRSAETPFSRPSATGGIPSACKNAYQWAD